MTTTKQFDSGTYLMQWRTCPQRLQVLHQITSENRSRGGRLLARSSSLFPCSCPWGTVVTPATSVSTRYSAGGPSANYPLWLQVMGVLIDVSSHSVGCQSRERVTRDLDVQGGVGV